jgi:hypothetical protein
LFGLHVFIVNARAYARLGRTGEQV